MSIDGSAHSNEDFDVSVSDDGLVVHATIDRPEKHNAINDNVMEGLIGLMEAVDGTDSRVVVIRGADGTFCSGGDLGGMEGDSSVADLRDNARNLSRFYEVITGMDALSVAVVEGYCLAAGCAVAAVCDFVVASEDAQFGTPEVNVGMFPMLAMAPIMRAVQEKAGLQMMFTGDHISAAEAEDIGLATEAVAGDDLDERVAELLDSLAASSPIMIAMGKEAYYTQRDIPFQEAHTYLKEMISLLMMSEDTKEGIKAFNEDRDPEWKAR
jgi:enoyl-CoA hydratase/carnithine racemase